MIKQLKRLKGIIKKRHNSIYNHMIGKKKIFFALFERKKKGMTEEILNLIYKSILLFRSCSNFVIDLIYIHILINNVSFLRNERRGREIKMVKYKLIRNVCSLLTILLL